MSRTETTQQAMANAAASQRARLTKWAIGLPVLRVLLVAAASALTWLIVSAFESGIAFLLSTFYPSAYIFFAGIMYVMAAAIWRAVPMLILGGWSILVSALAPFAGVPTQYLVFALAGGGGYLLVAVWSWVWMRRARRRLLQGDQP